MSAIEFPPQNVASQIHRNVLRCVRPAAAVLTRFDCLLQRTAMAVKSLEEALVPLPPFAPLFLHLVFGWLSSR